MVVAAVGIPRLRILVAAEKEQGLAVGRTFAAVVVLSKMDPLEADHRDPLKGQRTAAAGAVGPPTLHQRNWCWLLPQRNYFLMNILE